MITTTSLNYTGLWPIPYNDFNFLLPPDRLRPIINLTSVIKLFIICGKLHLLPYYFGPKCITS